VNKTLCVPAANEFVGSNSFEQVANGDTQPHGFYCGYSPERTTSHYTQLQTRLQAEPHSWLVTGSIHTLHASLCYHSFNARTNGLQARKFKPSTDAQSIPSAGRRCYTARR